MILSKYEFQSQQASCLMEGGGGRVRPPPAAPRPFPRIRHWTVTYRVPKVWTQHNFAGTQVLVLRHQVWAAPKKTCFESTPPPPASLSLSLSLPLQTMRNKFWWHIDI